MKSAAYALFDGRHSLILRLGFCAALMGAQLSGCASTPDTSADNAVQDTNEKPNEPAEAVSPATPSSNPNDVMSFESVYQRRYPEYLENSPPNESSGERSSDADQSH